MRDTQELRDRLRYTVTDRVRSVVRDHPLCTAATVILALSVVSGFRKGTDSNWDLLNYHFYNGWAFLNGHLGTDIAPANIQSYFNPLFDIPTALAISASTSTVVFRIWCVIVQWWCWFTVWRLIEEAGHRRLTLWWRMAAFVVVITGAGAWSLSFTTFNDWLMASFVCEGVRLLLRANRLALADSSTHITRIVCASGAMFALAISVKLTAAPFVVGAACVAAIVFTRQRFGAWLLGLAATFAVTSAPWMIYLWIRFDSPTFPWYNAIFQSPSAVDLNFKDPRYGFHSLREVLTFPIHLLRGTRSYSEHVYREWRILAVVALAVLVIAVALWRVRGQLRSGQLKRLPINVRSNDFLLGVFVAVSFIVWVVAFSYYRYLLPVEVVSSILVVLLIYRVIPKVSLMAVLVPLAMLFAHQNAVNWGRSTTSFRVSAPSIEKGSSILLASGAPDSFLAASFPNDTRWASTGGFSYDSKTRLFKIGGPLWRDLEEFVERAVDRNRLYILLSPSESEFPTLVELGIQPNLASCFHMAVGTYFVHDVRLCRAELITGAADGA